MKVIILVLFVISSGAPVSYHPFKIIADKIGGTNVEVENFESCPEYPNTPVKLRNVLIGKEGQNKFAINGRIEIQETVDRPLKLVIEMYRCSSRDDPGTCEYYFTFRKDRLCDMLENEDGWNYFVNGTDLPSTCPYNKGSYTLNGTTIDVRDLQWMPLFNSYWRISSKTFMRDKLMLCVKGNLIVKKQ